MRVQEDFPAYPYISTEIISGNKRRRRKVVNSSVGKEDESLLTYFDCLVL